MPTPFSHWYLVSPNQALLAEGTAESTAAWFAAPHLWRLSHVGDHDYQGQRALSERLMKLQVLATLHAEMDGENLSPSSREFARRLVHAAPLTVDRFDELWTMRDLGWSVNDGNSVDHLPVESLRAVRAAEVLSPDPWRPRTDAELWQEIISARERLPAAFTSASRLALRVLQQELSIETDQRRCELFSRLASLSHFVSGVFDGLSWSLDHRGPLRLVFEDQSDGFRFTFDWRPARGPQRRGELVVHEVYPAGQRVELVFKEFKKLEPADLSGLSV